ncbi:MAG: hypothetical protein J5846_03225 [Desulfovibrio sp.]|nr:hypothetical protein [Desulfovibrio sp.]
MKKHSYVFFASFLVCILALLTSVSSVQAERYLRITINNYSNEDVAIAVARKNGYNASDHETKGWYACGARKSVTVNAFIYNEEDNYYYFAVQRHRGVIASGNRFSGWIIHGKPFTSRGDKKLSGGTRVGFKPLKHDKGRVIINIGKR